MKSEFIFQTFFQPRLNRYIRLEVRTEFGALCGFAIYVNGTLREFQHIMILRENFKTMRDWETCPESEFENMYRECMR